MNSSAAMTQQEKGLAKQARADGSAQQTAVKTDAKLEQRLARDLEKIERYVPKELFNGHYGNLTLDFFLDTFRDKPNKAHTTAVLFSSKAFQNFDPRIRETVAIAAFSLTQNWTTDSVVELKNLVTSSKFANSDVFSQVEMLNKFTDTLLKTNR